MSHEIKNEKMVLSFGFFLILLVFVVTLFRNDFSSKSKTASQQSSVPSSSDQQTSAHAYQTISAKDLQKKVLFNEKLTLLDIRPFDSYIQEHILDAVNVPLDEFPVGDKIDLHTPVMLIGANGADGDLDTAFDKLTKEGFTDIKVLAGGMEAWKNAPAPTITYGDPTSFVDQSKVAYLDPENLNDALTQKAPVFIVDVRSKDAYDKGHIEGAINIPFDELEKRRSEVTQKKAVLVGDNELQEFQASVQLYDMLLISPYVMRGGMPKWQEKNFALSK